jgi:hypothetical protein
LPDSGEAEPRVWSSGSAGSRNHGLLEILLRLLGAQVREMREPEHGLRRASVR